MKATHDIKGLIKLLNHRNFDLQWRAADALGSMGEPVTNPLLETLNHGSIPVRIGAIEALGSVKDPRSVGQLIHILEHDKSVEVRWVTTLALGEIGDLRAIPVLVRALRHEERYVRYGAAKALGTLQWHADNAEDLAYYHIAMEDWASITKAGVAATGPLIEMLRDKDAVTRTRIIELLGQIGDPNASKACAMVLSDPDSNVRWEAVLTAKKCGVPVTHLPMGLSKRSKTGHNPWAAALLNFLFIGLGYDYLGYWWGLLVFMSYMSIVVLAQLVSGPFLPYVITYPITALFAVQTFLMAKRMPEM